MSHTRFTTSNHTSSKSMSECSLVSARQATALEVCALMYGDTDIPEADVVERIYEATAGVYENPLVTATSRDKIADLYGLCRACSALDIPRPLAFISSLLRHVSYDPSQVLLRGVRAWSEVGDISESESFDGHRRCIVEHAIHVLFLPGLHTPGDSQTASATPSSRRASQPSTRTHSELEQPALSIPGTSLAIRSPLHIKLPVTTKLSFNDAGRITHHRDLWDAADLLALLPGVPLAQWLGTRVASHAISAAWRTSKVLTAPFARVGAMITPQIAVDVESAGAPARANAKGSRAKNTEDTAQ